MKIVLIIWLALAAFIHAAGLEFERMLEEITAPVDAKEVTVDFRFTNKSDRPVTIAQSDPGCPCLKIRISGGKLQYAPGESGTVRATFEIGNFLGTVDKAIGLWLNNASSEKPTLQLTVRVHIPVLVTLEPKTVTWDLGGTLESKTISIRMAEGQTIRVLEVKCSSPDYTVERKTIEDGKKYDLVVTPKPSVGPGMQTIRIETDCPNSKQRVQQAILVTRKPVAGGVP